MTVLAPLDAVTRYTGEVRAALSQLGAADVDDLTDGLDADLAEALAELGPDADPWAAFGPPPAYALELSDAAEVTPLLPSTWRGRVKAWLAARAERRRTRRTERRERVRAWIDAAASHPVFGPYVALARELKPVWWVGRAMAAAFGWWTITSSWSSPRDTWLCVFLGLGLTIVSVQWGRGHWLSSRWQRVLRRLVGTACVVATLLGFVTAGSQGLHVTDEHADCYSTY